ncbi:MAG: Mov34/MPN/PAD-1 family protein [Bradymonadaceae bacterium]
MSEVLAESGELWGETVLEALAGWVEEAYPDEGCGLIVSDGDVYRVRGCENLADEYHEMDPETYPRTARKFFVIDPREFLRAEDRGESVEVIFHSHADKADYFSDEDVAAATLARDDEREPWEESHPGVDYLVVSVREGESTAATLFRFDDPHADHPFEPVRNFSF